MKTLIIHPKDSSTDFLKQIYAGKDCTVITGGDIADVYRQAELHDRIIGMGHGSPSGLFCVGQFRSANNFCHHVIDAGFVRRFKSKLKVCIWCWAKEFCYENDVDGFATGMFISEVGEAYAMGIEANQKEVDFSNNKFCEAANLELFNDQLNYPKIIERYGQYNSNVNSAVIKYNHQAMVCID